MKDQYYCEVIWWLSYDELYEGKKVPVNLPYAHPSEALVEARRRAARPDIYPGEGNFYVRAELKRADLPKGYQQPEVPKWPT